MNVDQQRQDYVAALDWVSGLIAATRPDQLGLPTPCVEFDVRALIGHLIGTALRGRGTVTRAYLRGTPHVVTDVADAELAPTFSGLAAEIARAATDLRSDELVTAAWGECSAYDALRGFTVETVTHGWDLAVATGQDPTVLDAVAARLLASSTELVPTRLRGVMYDDAAPTASSSATERLAYALGHQRVRGE
ncbi:TIGR03086 family metal-binding protein [Luteipulveratus halotolerans]|uniref:Mycothiol-dependent maleylpyruvate isomerase metal-binding domain-containing protein n=1 Tax=Luteipulveratus halotolerans TaxID=1631356 RepID=A0A0L6CLL8_9MICO|nr:TIGR03086 family metal-binding protein [Luteipulveratus halotolerans]KNX38647.1 hypothetical protein VV01_18270 [Luteipulveratus halotolerans]